LTDILTTRSDRGQAIQLSSNLSRRIVALLLAFACVRSTSGPDRIAHDAYIWQRHWTPALTRAIDANADLFGTWHVLAADIAASGQITNAQVNWAQVRANAHPVVPVIRIEGQIAAETMHRLVASIVAVLATLPVSVRRRLEVDHDSATARLAGYARFLTELRAALGAGTVLSITVLPTWLFAPAFSAVADAADLLVLQVHSIDDPRVGLFDANRAARWVDVLAHRTRRSFLVALPTYGARVAASPAGKLLAVSAEMHALDGDPGSEIAASPTMIASFLDRLRYDSPDGFRGVVWFRLPTTDDRRALSAVTLREVINGGTLRSSIDVVTRPGWTSGMSDILVVNKGEIDGILPTSVLLPDGCDLADGVGQYELDGARLKLRGNGPGLLRAHDAVLAGWMTCDRIGEGLHVEN
jgi:hypothetical protein